MPHKPFAFPLLVLLAALIACNLLDPPTPDPPPGTTAAWVTHVVDGDTIEVEIEGREFRVRYILIDTPETKHPSRPVEPFGPKAAAANKALVEGKTVYLEKDVSDVDQYGRLLRYVYADGLLVNEELVRRGLARVATFPPDVKYVDRFLAVQKEAQEAGAGMWAEGGDHKTVIISEIFFDGQVPQVESDEYVEFKNTGQSMVDLTGWQLQAGRSGSSYTFEGLVLKPGQSCRIYTNEIHPETCGLSFGSKRPLWRNAGDCGFLYNAEKEVVSNACY